MNTETARLVDSPSVSGRMTPRPAPLPEGFAHEVRFEPLPGDSGYAYLRAVCEPCAWSVALDGGHDLADLQRLVVMHAGPAPLGEPCGSVMGSTACQLPAGHYGHHHAMVGCHSITWPKDES